VHWTDHGMAEHQAEASESRKAFETGGEGQGMMIRNVRSGLVSSRRVSVSKTRRSHDLAVAGEWA
jgi:hypothetical protein